MLHPIYMKKKDENKKNPLYNPFRLMEPFRREHMHIFTNTPEERKPSYVNNIIQNKALVENARLCVCDSQNFKTYHFRNTQNGNLRLILS